MEACLVHILAIMHTLNFISRPSIRIVQSFVLFFALVASFPLGAVAQEDYNVVYVDFANGNDSNDGTEISKAVKTWAKAYKLLPVYTGTTDAERDYAWDHNIIVVCDKEANTDFTITDNIAKGNGTQGIPATFTGVWPWTPVPTGDDVRNGGIIGIQLNNQNGNLGDKLSRIGADTKFKYLRFGRSKINHPNPTTGGPMSGQSCYFNMYLHDAFFDVGCSMDDVTEYLQTANGALTEGSAPDFHIMMYADTHDFSKVAWPNPTKPMKLIIRSGKIGRILSCRTTGTQNAQILQRYVIGTPQYPLLGIMELDIDPIENAKWNTKFADCPYDVSFCCAGSTQGTEYCDVRYDIKRAKIGKLVAATQGMNIQAAENVGISCSTFLGRTVINLIPAGWETGTADNNDIVIEQFYGACLGRSSTTLGTCNAAFYGTSQLNMYGGIIQSGAYLSAGGISGLQSPDGKYHTIDKFVPYPDNAPAYANYPFNGIKYQPYDASKTIVEFTTRMDGTEKKIDLANTSTEMNIYGGIINGGLYGGSYGYSYALAKQYALEHAGSMWGTTNVNIYGGTINGGVYGGGKGATEYYNLAANDADRKRFSTVAAIYGNTYVNVYGGTIEGGIYGGGLGMASQAKGTKMMEYLNANNAVVKGNVNVLASEFLDIGKVYGTTNVTIDPVDPNWEYVGNIYGGGALGAVDGVTNVNILGGIIDGDVFGASKGEEGHPNKAKVTGTANVNVGKKKE